MKTTNLLTPWGKTLQNQPQQIPLPEYPRPQLRREHWQNLNGWWEYAITKSNQRPYHFAGQIRVPFSPESRLSGVQRVVQPDDFLWYRRSFKLTEFSADQPKIQLHFGAVDQSCQVYLNGTKVDAHTGGYWPFTCDITTTVHRQDTNELVICVQDPSDNAINAYGKQRLNHGKIWYTPQSGIWQTVWLEALPNTYLKDLTITPLFDQGQVQFQFKTNQPFKQGQLSLIDHGHVVKKYTFTTKTLTCSLKKWHPWSPADPHLYQVQIQLDQDQVQSYFGMRKFSYGLNRHHQVVPLLNNQPIYFNGLLDQGYWSDGLYTAPSDQALAHDIQQMKSLGFNMLRKHIKIEPLRWYYHCDRLGMMVWQDFVNGGLPYRPLIIQVLPFLGQHLQDHRYRLFGRQSPQSRQRYRWEAAQTQNLLKNVTSLAVWVPFNEGWGQVDSLKTTAWLRTKDPSRLIDHASGWHDQGGGDFHSRHVYFHRFHLHADPHRRIQVLSEFGGYSLPIKHHMYSSKMFGYQKYQTKATLTAAYRKLIEREILPAIQKGLAGTVYTQVSDVEDEINGLVTFDRQVLKIDAATVRTLNRKIAATFAKNQT